MVRGTAGAVVHAEAQFELEWLGGGSERLLRKRRPGTGELPWGTLDRELFSEDALLEARKVWTNGAFTEYASAAAFTTIAGALMEYNGKFMDNQRVLRGGSFATPRCQARACYRNFWPPDTRFQATGVRLLLDR